VEGERRDWGGGWSELKWFELGGRAREGEGVRGEGWGGGGERKTLTRLTPSQGKLEVERGGSKCSR
jgi:hypothetical protein